MATYSNTYPRPDFVRSKLNWKPLNDSWKLLFDDEDVGLKEGWHLTGTPEKAAPIQLPFAFQTAASGWGDNEDAHEVLWYETRLDDPRQKDDTDAGHRVVVRFGAVDYLATVWADGALLGEHRGGHVPFEVDVTDALSKAAGKGSRIVMRVRDSPSDLEQPRGKQYWAPTPESIFYHPTSGVWQSVWVEVVPAARIGTSSDGTVLRSNDIDSGVVKAKIAVLGRKAAGKYEIEIEGSLGGLSVGKARQTLPKDKDYVKLDLGLKLSLDQMKALPAEVTKSAPLDNSRSWKNGVALWSPDHPTLYDLAIRLYDSQGQLIDEAKTYTGMRNIDWTTGDGTFRLNGEPLFQALNLDQGYWPETGLTPPNPDSLKIDIELAKKMGFNGCRKHQKVEDPIFLYWADKLGYLVWGEMANAYEFSDEYVERFDQEWMESVKRDINHPSIIVWTPVNESWAYPDLKDNVEQRNHIRSLYYMTKTLDPTRPINDNCGWEHICDDLSTFHDYHDAPALAKTNATLESTLSAELHGGRGVFVRPIPGDGGCKHREGAPVICSEFGGVNIAPSSEAEKGERDWGYTTASDPQDLLKRIEAIVMAVIKPGHVSGFVWTQLTDIEQEVNGLYSFDRKEKINPAEVKKIFDKAAGVYLDQVTKK
ncbi:glycoside hydrolase family 2 protein [Pseudomassariella vexata]|uniref:Glycoside hydrolase family 2 protein n=1 Tax=Pseudomassariella vexata TaxID=1141098 RepID=A0A1Y2DEH3_9PEZI|nr:glycoside hydrolase family 2 protein [Pseudomassariella vexata]ORY57494.1 glycoside hydrolase family 2 protein [Pseudomassariella vexata]